MTIATFGTLMDADNCPHKLLYSMSFDFSFSYTTGKKKKIFNLATDSYVMIAAFCAE